MDRVQYFIWLSEQAASCAAHVGFVFPGLLVIVALALAVNSPFARSRYHHGNWLIFTPVLITFLILLVGTVFEYESGRSPLFPQLLNVTLALLHLPILGLLLRKLPGVRWFTAAANLLIMWCSWWAWFVSAMSVSGDWL